jgi:hypothetical protein
MDIRLHSSGGIFDAIRRVEYMALLALAGASMFLLSTPLAALLATPSVLLALVMVPGRSVVRDRTRERMDTLNELQNEGLGYRSRWVALGQEPLTEKSSLERWTIQRDIVIWIYQCNRRLGPFPEVGGIFEAHDKKNDLIDELDACLTTLSRIRRILSLSETLQLPI